MTGPAPRAAIVGAGLSGATCAHFLAQAGLHVEVFDKSRGVGGRLATRRAAWLDATGRERLARFDHGAPGFVARSPEFLRVVEQARRQGVLAPWHPVLHPDGPAESGTGPWWVPAPDMPAWCREGLAGRVVRTGCTVESLRREPDGWRLDLVEGPSARGFDVVVVAVPPRQAAPLLRPHRADWAGRLESLPMRATWTLMAITADDGAPAWDLAWPASDVLACVLRDDAKPGRQRLAGLAHWVVHATPGWSEACLEDDPLEVLPRLQQAFADWLGRPLAWRHAAVHRWRYAFAGEAAGRPASPEARGCEWDAALGLGACGDALGGAGVEGAWASGRAVAEALCRDWQKATA